jgi:hypothetical protein
MFSLRLYFYFAAALLGFVPIALAADLPLSLDSIAKDLAIAVPVRVVRTIDREECDTKSNKPGVVRVDLNGDGIPDYAVLLETSKAKETVNWNGRTLEKTDVFLAVLLSRLDKTFYSLKLETIETFRPVPLFVSRQKPGLVVDKSTGKRIRLPTAGVSLTFCGKSQKAWYWSDGSFKDVWLSD